MKQPVRMLAEFMPAFVEAIQRREEGRRVGNMNHNGPVVLGAYLPDRIQLGIIDRHQLAVFVAVA